MKLIPLIASLALLSLFSSDFINFLGSKEYTSAYTLILPLSIGLTIEIINDINNGKFD